MINKKDLDYAAMDVLVDYHDEAINIKEGKKRIREIVEWQKEEDKNNIRETILNILESI